MTAATAVPTLHRLDEDSRSALFHGARTANSFADIPVSDAELSSIWDLVKWPPTAINTQPLRVVYVTSSQARDRLARHMNEGNKAKTLAAPAVAVLAADSRFHEFLPTVAPHKQDLMPFFENNEAGRLEAAHFNAALQAGYFLLSVRAHGLAAGPMGGFDKAGVDTEFFPDGRWRSILVVNIGHPAVDAYRDRLPRLSSDLTATFA